MAQRFCFVLALMLGISSSAVAQQADPILFTVEDKPVRVSEFDYIYQKTNGEKADYSKASLQEYLDLYTRFKLKVQKARDLQLDTIESLKRELNGYRQQLADSYRINQEITAKLVRDLYERSKEDVRVSHILVSLSENATPADTLKALQTSRRLMGQVRSEAASFEEVARQFSDDPSAKNNGGDLGFLNVPFPNGFYPLERAVYNTAEGDMGGPVRTSAGYHIFKVEERRAARGEIEVAHILLRTKGKAEAEVKSSIDSIYAALQEGASFEQLAKQVSEDRATAPKGGYIGFFGINQYDQRFEDAAFDLDKDGAISEPVKSPVGYHIIKRISKQGIQPYNQVKARLENLIKKDGRYQKAKDQMLLDIKEDADFTEYMLPLERFVAAQNDTFRTFRWKAPANGSDDVLFNIGQKRFTVADFAAFLEKNVRQRMRIDRQESLADAIVDLYQDYVETSLMRYEQDRLEERYPEFRSLMREYEEGILLFEVTKMKVWDKASRDTSGLRAFYESEIKGQGLYQYNERAITTRYTVSAADKNQLDALRSFAANNERQAVMQQYGDILKVAEEEVVERGKSSAAADIKTWEAGSLTITTLNRREGTYTFRKIEEILPAREKRLDEARGYIIADYQDHLEEQWVSSLKEEYEIEINEDALMDLVKK